MSAVSRLGAAGLKFSSIFYAVVVNFYLASVLEKSEFGLFGVLTAVFVIAVTLGNFGVNYFLIDVIPKESDGRRVSDHFTSAYIISCLFCLLFGLLAYLYVSYGVSPVGAGLKYDWPSVFLVVGVVVLQGLNSIHIVVFRALLRFKTALALESFAFNSALALAAFVLADSESVDVSVLIFIGSLVAFSISLLLLYMELKKIDAWHADGLVKIKELEIGMVKRFLPFALLGFAETLSVNLDVVIVNTFVGGDSSAEYYMAKKFIVIFSFFWILYNYVAAPKLSSCFSEGACVDRIRVVELMKKRWSVLATTFVLCASILFLYEDALRILGLDEYHDIGAYLFVFSLFAILHIATGPVVSFMNVSGLKNSSYWVVGSGAVVFIIAAPILAHFFAAIGVIIAMCISLLFWKVLGWFQIRKVLGFDIFFCRWI